LLKKDKFCINAVIFGKDCCINPNRSYMKENEIVIAMAGKPVAKLTPIEKKPRRRPGALKGKIKIAKDFDNPLPEDILSDFKSSL
jgi:hypothetical protein